MSLQISEKVRALGLQAQEALTQEFARIDAVAEENSARVLAAFQNHRVADGYFAGTTGYGYDDQGRDKLDEIYAQLFGTEAALVRIQFVNGTHAIACALFGALKAGDVLVSAVGAPYDTLLGVIGAANKGHGSLADYGVEYRQVELVNDQPDLEGMAKASVRAHSSYEPPRRTKAPVHTDRLTIGKTNQPASAENRRSMDALSPGDRVTHASFGEGEILSIKPMGADKLIEVMFDTAGTKKLMGTYAKLKKL